MSIQHPVSHARSRPGGRTERVRLEVAMAVLQLLEEERADFSYSDVAERSGVHRATLYRRWPQRNDLLQEALSLHTGALTVPDTGNWPEDIRILSEDLARFFSSPVERNMTSAMLADPSSATNRAILDYWAPVFDELAAPVKRAQTRGELPKHLDAMTVLQMVVNPMVMHTLVTREAVPAELIERLVEIMLALGHRT